MRVASSRRSRASLGRKRTSRLGCSISARGTTRHFWTGGWVRTRWRSMPATAESWTSTRTWAGERWRRWIPVASATQPSPVARPPAARPKAECNTAAAATRP